MSLSHELNEKSLFGGGFLKTEIELKIIPKSRIYCQFLQLLVDPECSSIHSVKLAGFLARGITGGAL